MTATPALATAARETHSVSLRLLVASGEAFEPFVKRDFPFPVALGLRNLVRQVRTAVELFEEKRLTLCNKYGTFNEETGNYDLGENVAVFTKEYEALLDTPVELKFNKLTPADITTDEDGTISVLELEYLSWLIDFGPEEAGPPEAAGSDEEE